MTLTWEKDHVAVYYSSVRTFDFFQRRKISSIGRLNGFNPKETRWRSDRAVRINAGADPNRITRFVKEYFAAVHRYRNANAIEFSEMPSEAQLTLFARRPKNLILRNKIIGALESYRNHGSSLDELRDVVSITWRAMEAMPYSLDKMIYKIEDLLTMAQFDDEDGFEPQLDEALSRLEEWLYTIGGGRAA